jgi:hypothetical protein
MFILFIFKNSYKIKIIINKNLISYFFCKITLKNFQNVISLNYTQNEKKINKLDKTKIKKELKPKRQ